MRRPAVVGGGGGPATAREREENGAVLEVGAGWGRYLGCLIGFAGQGCGGWLGEGALGSGVRREESGWHSASR